MVVNIALIWPISIGVCFCVCQQSLTLNGNEIILSLGNLVIYANLLIILLRLSHDDNLFGYHSNLLEEEVGGGAHGAACGHRLQTLLNLQVEFVSLCLN